VEAQKKLLNLAIHEVEVASRSTRERAEAAEPQPRTTLGDATQRTVRNIVAAQKSLMDLAVRPDRSPAPERPRKKAAARPGPARRKKAAGA
jgi:hypothetical protein